MRSGSPTAIGIAVRVTAPAADGPPRVTVHVTSAVAAIASTAPRPSVTVRVGHTAGVARVGARAAATSNAFAAAPLEPFPGAPTSTAAAAFEAAVVTGGGRSARRSTTGPAVASSVTGATNRYPRRWTVWTYAGC